MKLELTALTLVTLESPQKSPYSCCPYIAKLTLAQRSVGLTHSEIVQLHECLRSMCPQRFAWYCPLPPELWVNSLIYEYQSIEVDSLSQTQAMRIDIKPGEQFSGELSILLNAAHLVTFRKISYRIRSDFEDFAQTSVSYRGV